MERRIFSKARTCCGSSDIWKYMKLCTSKQERQKYKIFKKNGIQAIGWQAKEHDDCKLCQ